MTLEADVKDAIKKYLKSIGAFWYMPVPMGFGAASVDFFICYKEKFYAVEAKRPGINEPTIRQGEVLKAVAEAGGGACVENDPLLPTLKRILGEI